MNKLYVKKVSSADINLLFDFKRTIYPEGHKALNMELWQWKFSNDKSDFFNYYILISDDKVVGGQGYTKINVSFNGKIHYGIFVVEFNVNQKFRGLPVIKLFRAVSKEGDILVSANTSEDANRFFTSAKWIDKSLLVKELYYFTKYPNLDTLGKLKHIIKNGTYLLKKIVFRRRFKDNFLFKIQDSILPIEFTGEPFYNNQKTYFIKDPEYIADRYIAHPAGKYKFATLFIDDELVVMIVFMQNKSGERQEYKILDVIQFCQNTHFIKKAIYEFIEYQLEFSKNFEVTYLTSNSEIIKTITEVGFSVSNSNLGYYLNSNIIDIKKKIRDIEVMSLNVGDTDRY